jgi:hypothetical protein
VALTAKGDLDAERTHERLRAPQAAGERAKQSRPPIIVSRPWLPETKGRICVSTVSIVCGHHEGLPRCAKSKNMIIVILLFFAESQPNGRYTRGLTEKPVDSAALMIAYKYNPSL